MATVNKALSPTYLALLAGHDPNSVTSTAAHSSPSATGEGSDADAGTIIINNIINYKQN